MFTIAPPRGLLAHHRAGRVRARDRALEVDGQQEVELALPVPVRRLAGEHVGARVVDPHVEAAEPLARLGDERLAAGARAEVGLRDERAAAARRDALGDRPRGRLAAAVGDEHRGAGAGERLRDRGADAAARARDDGAGAVEPELAGCDGVRCRATPRFRRRTGGAPSAAASSTACDGRLARQRAGDRLLRRLVVVVEDLLVVGRLPVDEDADDRRRGRRPGPPG